jgi:hypothetical protein
MSLVNLEQKIIDRAGQKNYGTQEFAADIDANLDFLAKEALYYGVKWTLGQNNPVVTPIGRSAFHETLPLQNAIYHCTLNDDRTVNYKLDGEVLGLKADGTASDLSGADGQVAGIFPKYWWKTWVENNDMHVAISPYQISGFNYMPSLFMGTWPGSLDNGKLSSVSGVMPVTSRTPIQFLQDARNRGAGFNSLDYRTLMTLFWFHLIEMKSFNFQSTVSDGVTNASGIDWSNYNGYNPFIQNGVGKNTPVKTGEIPVTIPNFANAGVDPLNTQVAVYRQFRLLTGIFEWIVGAIAHNSSAQGPRALITYDPANYAYDTEVGHTYVGNLPENDDYILEFIPGTILPGSGGGSSTTHKCDYHYTSFDDSPDNGFRAFMWFGLAHLGSPAGLGCSYGSYSSGDSRANSGSRLCGEVVEEDEQMP